MFKFGILLFTVTVLGQIFSSLSPIPFSHPLFFFLFSPQSLFCSCFLSPDFSLAPFLSFLCCFSCPCSHSRTFSLLLVLFFSHTLFPKKKQLSEIQAIDRHTVLLWKGLQSPEGLHLLSSCVHKVGWGADVSAHHCFFAKCGY